MCEPLLSGFDSVESYDPITVRPALVCPAVPAEPQYGGPGLLPPARGDRRQGRAVRAEQGGGRQVRGRLSIPAGGNRTPWKLFLFH